MGLKINTAHAYKGIHTEAIVVNNDDVVTISHGIDTYRIGVPDLIKIIHNGYIGDKERLDNLYARAN